MKKIILLSTIVIAGCTSVDMPRDAYTNADNAFVPERAIKNGYDNWRLMPGRRKNPEYKTLLVHGEWITAMSRYAYDYDMMYNGDIRIYLWDKGNYKNIVKSLLATYGNFTGPYKEDGKIILKLFERLVSSNEITVSGKLVKMLTKDERDEYLKNNPDTFVFFNA
jgi:hypothetical protein